MIQRLAAGMMLLSGSVLMAQNAAEIQDVTPRWVSVTTPAASLHCGDLARFYAVADLAAGSVLRIDGESDQWARVIYPAGVFPFVPASEARDLGNDRVALTVASQLRAPSKLMGLSGSWRSVYRTALPAGTEFEVMGRETNTDGDVTAYAVKPVFGNAINALPHGYIRKEALTDATEAQIQAHLVATGAKAEPTETDSPATEPAQTPPAGNDAPGGQTPADVNTELLNPINTTLPTGEAVPTDPATPPATDPASGPSNPDLIEQADVGTVTEPDADAYADEYGIKPARLVELEDAFEEARQLPREELDTALEELLAEYQRAIEALVSTDGASVERSLQSRIDWLKIRMDTRDARLELNAFLADTKDTRDRNAELVENWQSGQAFDYVGRVLVSRVYDGKRLPKMYRLVENDPLNGPRTLGYLPEGGELDAGRYVGQVIGVRGSIELNPASRLRIVKPESVTVMPE
ncbi:MAG: hypothetical protein ACI89L_001466 [Phycisphaerales bacterium]|jgi:hypothetical protein